MKVERGQRSTQMANSMGTGDSLVEHNGFGADVIRFPAGGGVANHTHEGDHILFCIAGEGYVVYEGEPHKLYPGVCYFVLGSVDHAIKANSDLVLIAVGNKHHPVGSPKRMVPVPYNVTTPTEMRI
ncbi:cupin domain-containing protein [Janthinobacterium fluminis]|nr:cupin domain-containing protein [Janthinobacterium fluminis]